MAIDTDVTNKYDPILLAMQSEIDAAVALNTSQQAEIDILKVSGTGVEPGRVEEDLYFKDFYAKRSTITDLPSFYVSLTTFVNSL